MQIYSVLMAVKSENDFQSFILAICHWEMNPDQVAHQTSIKIILENAIGAKSPDLNTSKYKICHHPKKIGKVIKMGIWVLHNNENRIPIETSVLSKQRNNPFFKNIITAWYNNDHWKRQWTDKYETGLFSPSKEFHWRKVILWDHRVVIFLRSQTLKIDFYSQHQKRVYQNLLWKCPAHRKKRCFSIEKNRI